MNSKEELQEQGRKLYENKVSQKDIAAQLGVTLQTIGNWKRRYQWERPLGPPKDAPGRHHVEVHIRVAAFTMFCNHITPPIIAEQLNVSPKTVNRWQWEDGWEDRRAARLESEVTPGWAQRIESMLSLVYSRQNEIQKQLDSLTKVANH